MSLVTEIAKAVRAYIAANYISRAEMQEVWNMADRLRQALTSRQQYVVIDPLDHRREQRLMAEFDKLRAALLGNKEEPVPAYSPDPDLIEFADGKEHKEAKTRMTDGA